MKLSATVTLALSLVLLVGCGDDDHDATTGRPATRSAAQAPPAAARPPARPRRLPPGVTVSTDTPGDRFRADGRSWEDCGATVDNAKSGYDLYGVAVSGPVRCKTATGVVADLSRQVQRREAGGTDCFPGYCTADQRQPTTVAGYRCEATDYGDVSVSLVIVCRSDDRYIRAEAADDE